MACSWKQDRAIEKEIEQVMDRKRQSRSERGAKVSIKEAWSLWTIAARFKVPPSPPPPQKKPSSAMTDSADKRWSMKADRCADSRREALAPVGRMHYCGQMQLSGPNGLSALCHATTLTSHSKELEPIHPPSSLLHLLHSSIETFPGRPIAPIYIVYICATSVDRRWNDHISAISWHIDNVQRNAGSGAFLTGKT